ncbi:membrane protein [Cellvibrio zantedeschiae]|uniref:Membrane protein n=2 Tax=Cellvibrio zantedeschiae TaxID=1237077 RepID=A0ABQ3ASG0_9GAMM|nr:membrane protein [Cellvibrio zantedeschiae]
MYTADMTSSEWKLASNPFSCSLTHTIPVFGKAIFSRKAGGAEAFYLESQGKVVFPGSVAGAETLPPQWRNDLVPVPLGAFKVEAGNQPIKLTTAQIAPVVAQLTAGVNVMYSSQPVVSASSSSSIMRVVLNAKNFAAGFKSYQQCIADLIPYSFAQVARTSINYAEKPEGLTAAQKAELGKVARYIKADPNVVGVFVDGHSDNSGAPEANEALSKQEAEWVAAYLTEQGVAATKITTRWHGDKFVIADNKTAAGRAQNRRVTVRLEDEAAHKEFMKKEEEKRKADEKASAEKAAAESKMAATSAAASSSASSKARMTPEEISRMVERYDLKNPKR